jgi:hypothetical protein
MSQLFARWRQAGTSFILRFVRGLANAGLTVPAAAIIGETRGTVLDVSGSVKGRLDDELD